MGQDIKNSGHAQLPAARRLPTRRCFATRNCVLGFWRRNRKSLLCYNPTITVPIVLAHQHSLSPTRTLA